jgi:hypothetical protein
MKKSGRLVIDLRDRSHAADALSDLNAPRLNKRSLDVDDIDNWHQA